MVGFGGNRAWGKDLMILGSIVLKRMAGSWLLCLSFVSLYEVSGAVSL